jgi:hypothetical protein
MRARYCNALWGRFLSVDPVAGDPSQPQAWNRYVYARNNPFAFIDPDGRKVTLVDIRQSQDRDLLIDQLRTRTGLDLYYDSASGTLQSRGLLRDSKRAPVGGSAIARREVVDAITSDTTFAARKRDD